MACLRSQRPVTVRPPNAASLRGLQAARAALEDVGAPMTADELAQLNCALSQAPYRKRQHDLVLVLPEADAR